MQKNAFSYYFLENVVKKADMDIRIKALNLSKL